MGWRSAKVDMPDRRCEECDQLVGPLADRMMAEDMTSEQRRLAFLGGQQWAWLRLLELQADEWIWLPPVSRMVADITSGQPANGRPA